MLKIVLRQTPNPQEKTTYMKFMAGGDFGTPADRFHAMIDKVVQHAILNDVALEPESAGRLIDQMCKEMNVPIAMDSRTQAIAEAVELYHDTVNADLGDESRY